MCMVYHSLEIAYGGNDTMSEETVIFWKEFQFFEAYSS